MAGRKHHPRPRFRPTLEILEDRVLLNASLDGQAASAFMGDLAHLSNDVATSAHALVNAVQPSQTNTPTLASLANEWNKVKNVLVTDWDQTRQAAVNFAFAVVETVYQEFAALLKDAETLLADLGIRLTTGQSSSTSAPVPSSSSSSSSSGSGTTPGQTRPVPAPNSSDPSGNLSGLMNTYTNGPISLNGSFNGGISGTFSVTYNSNGTFSSGNVSIDGAGNFILSGGTATPSNGFNGNSISGSFSFSDGTTISGSGTFSGTETAPGPPPIYQGPLSGSINANVTINPPLTTPVTPSCNCGCPNQPGSLVQNAPKTTGPAPRSSTDKPVRYADGVVTLAETDLHSDGFGFPWGQTRAWTNAAGYATNSDNGNGWVDTYIPHLIQADGSTNNTLIFIANGNTAYYYDLVNGSYQPRLDDGSQLIYNSKGDTFTLIDTLGDQIIFDGFGSSYVTARKGQFVNFSDPYGTQLYVTSFTSDGHIAEMQRSATSNGNTTTESWLYSYLPSSDANAGLLSGVTLRTQIIGVSRYFVGDIFLLKGGVK